MQRMYSASASGVKNFSPGRALAELPANIEFGIGAHQALGEIEGLGHEEPMPGEQAPGARHVVQQMVGRDDVDDGGPRHLVRVVEAHPVQHARAAIMPRRGKALEAELRHDLDIVRRHGAEGIIGVVLAVGRLGGIAIAPEIGAHHGEVARQAAAPPACQETWVKGLPCISSTGGPLPPWTATMRAPPVSISVLVKPSNIPAPSIIAHGSRAALAQARNPADDRHHDEGHDQERQPQHRDQSQIAALVQIIDQDRDQLGVGGGEHDGG